MFKVGEIYSISELSGGKFRGEYDGFIIIADGVIDGASMWHAELMDQYQTEHKGLSEGEAFQMAYDEMVDMLSTVYEDAKEIALFEGVPPVPPGRGFDFFSTFKCKEVV